MPFSPSFWWVVGRQWCEHETRMHLSARCGRPPLVPLSPPSEWVGAVCAAGGPGVWPRHEPRAARPSTASWHHPGTALARRKKKLSRQGRRNGSALSSRWSHLRRISGYQARVAHLRSSNICQLLLQLNTHHYQHKGIMNTFTYPNFTKRFWSHTSLVIAYWLKS